MAKWPLFRSWKDHYLWQSNYLKHFMARSAVLDNCPLPGNYRSTWSLATTRKSSLTMGGYHIKHWGTALCSILSELTSRTSSVLLFTRSYSTWKIYEGSMWWKFSDMLLGNQTPKPTSLAKQEHATYAGAVTSSWFLSFVPKIAANEQQILSLLVVLVVMLAPQVTKRISLSDSKQQSTLAKEKKNRHLTTL